MPNKWWDKKLGKVAYPVSAFFEGSKDCGVSFDRRPNEIFEPLAKDFNRQKLDHTGVVLGFWAASVDHHFDDTHLWIRPTSAAGAGKVKNIIDNAIDKNVSGILLPFVFLADSIFGDCKDCDKDALNIADKINPVDDIEGLIPGVGDVSGDKWVGVWHHINVTSRGSNEYDDRQGELFEEAGPFDVSDPLDLVLMAVFDISGLSVNYDDSNGVHQYQVTGADDGMPNTNLRNRSQWQYTTIAHIAFEPVDNLAYYGWRSFRDGVEHPVSSLAWPLHALGDATVPMHVTATSAWGHRPFEDAQERLWPQISKADVPLVGQEQWVRATLMKAFEWWHFITQWRKVHTGHDTDTPVREMVTELAKRTLSYSMTAYEETGHIWPFNPAASTLYIIDEGAAISLYTGQPNTSDLVRPLFEDGIGATLALLVSASEILPEPLTEDIGQ